MTGVSRYESNQACVMIAVIIAMVYIFVARDCYYVHICYNRFGQEDYVTYNNNRGQVTVKQQHQQPLLYVNYSKAEHLVAYNEFDWLITPDKNIAM